MKIKAKIVKEKGGLFMVIDPVNEVSEFMEEFNIKSAGGTAWAITEEEVEPVLMACAEYIAKKKKLKVKKL